MLILCTSLTYVFLLSVTAATGSVLVTKGECPLHIATLATNEYLTQSAFLRRQVAKFSGSKCSLEIFTTNCTFQELKKYKVQEGRRHQNPFTGIDVKIGAILSFLERIPQGDMFLWLDSSMLVLNRLNFYRAKLFLKNRDILFAQEGSYKKKSPNIGVILMKNTPDTTMFFNATLDYVRQGFWDQGVVCCLIGVHTGYSCEHIKPKSENLKWSYLNHRFAVVKKIGPYSCDISKKFKGVSKKQLPMLLKLIGNSERRERCLQIHRRKFKLE